MDVSADGQSPSQPNHPKPKGRFTGERLKVLRPQVYRRVVELLAEPREHVPYDHIARLLHVGEHTIKAVERTEAVPIAERKQRLLVKAARIADKAADRIEDQLGKANITQATVAFGVATEKMLLLNNDPTMHLQHSIEPNTGQDIYTGLQAIVDSLRACLKQVPAAVSAPLALPAPEVGS